MTNKELNKVQNEVKKASEKTLTGAVKAWCQLFKSGKGINEILKDNVCFYLILKFCPSVLYHYNTEGLFVPIFYRMIAYSYVLLTHKSVKAANFKP